MQTATTSTNPDFAELLPSYNPSLPVENFATAVIAKADALRPDTGRGLALIDALLEWMRDAKPEGESR